MSKQVCYDAMRIARGGGVVARDMMPHEIRSPVRTVYRTIDSDISNGELVFWTTCGPANTFDPKITGVAGTWFFDDGTTLDAASGAEISKTFAAEGLHRAVYRPASGGLAAITAIDCNTDLIVSVQGIERCTSVDTLTLSNNSLVVPLSLFSPMRSLTNLSINATDTYGDIAIVRNGMLYLYAHMSDVSGSVVSLPSSLRAVYLFRCAGITSGSIAHIVAARDIGVYSLGWLTADVDTVIDSMWAARANYTYATPSLQIGGTNQAPTGNVIAPVEGTDWHQDGATWIPLTTGAKAYDLAKDVNSEGFKKWSITYTGGSIAP